MCTEGFEPVRESGILLATVDQSINQSIGLV
jgi:hypothetical protein